MLAIAHAYYKQVTIVAQWQTKSMGQRSWDDKPAKLMTMDLYGQWHKSYKDDENRLLESNLLYNLCMCYYSICTSYDCWLD